ncbi:MAG TPA: hypothetical protein VGC57_09820 [Cellulomonas sp.]
MSTTTTGPRRPSLRTALLAASGIAIVGTVTATMSAWTDTATITGDLSSGTFDLTLNGAATAELGTADQVVSPGEDVNGSYTLANASSTDATVDLTVAGFTGATTGAWDLTITVDGAEVFSGDPTTATGSIALGAADAALDLDPAGTAVVDVTLTLVDSATAPQSEAVAPVLTFTAEQI